MDFREGTLQTAYGPDMVISIPFSSEVKVKTIIVIGGEEGTAPSKMKVWKNRETVDIDILEEPKTALQTIDMNENPDG